jgi:hypothetical protein
MDSESGPLSSGSTGPFAKLGFDLLKALDDDSFDVAPAAPPPGFEKKFSLEIPEFNYSGPQTAPATTARQLFPPVKGTHKRVDSSEENFNPKDKKQALYKTEMCRSWEETGTCRYGQKCQFAHSIQELRVVDRHPKYKTEMCKTFWEKGTCPYGKRCCFIHTDRADFEAKSSTPPPLAIRTNLSQEVSLHSPRVRSISEGHFDTKTPTEIKSAVPFFMRRQKTMSAFDDFDPNAAGPSLGDPLTPARLSRPDTTSYQGPAFPSSPVTRQYSSLMSPPSSPTNPKW